VDDLVNNLKYYRCEISRELAEVFEEEEKKDENLISKFMDNFKKFKEKLTESSQGLDTYARHLLELADHSIPFGNLIN
jgi:seryl-tRNA synthetase